MNNHISEAIEHNKNIIINRWQERILNEVHIDLEGPYDSEDSRLPLINHWAQKYFNYLISLLSHEKIKKKISDENNITHQKTANKKFAKSLMTKNNFSMEDIVHDLSILRQIIFQTLDLNENLNSSDRDLIIDSIEEVITDSVSEFSNEFKEVQEQFTTTIDKDIREVVTNTKQNTNRLSILLEQNHSSNNDPQMEILVTKIKYNMNKLNYIIDSLLDYRMIKSSRDFPLKLESFDLVVLLMSVVKKLEVEYGNRFTLQIPESLIGSWNKDGINKILINLISNALKYGTSTTPVTIVLRKSDQSEKAIIVIHNDGETIFAKECDSLFQGHQHGQFSQSLSGWGLGLTITKSIVESHNGTIKIESSESNGTCFIVEI